MASAIAMYAASSREPLGTAVDLIDTLRELKAQGLVQLDTRPTGIVVRLAA
jgi:hypothetical protein